jgi:hypothetical protein
MTEHYGRRQCSAFRVEGVGAMDHQLGLVIIFLLVVVMMVASWIAVRCGIRGPN